LRDVQLRTGHLPIIVKLNRDLGMALDTRHGINGNLFHRHSYPYESGDRVIR
jgi:hypothetical protein